jgi:hypothetical protein
MPNLHFSLLRLWQVHCWMGFHLCLDTRGKAEMAGTVD